MGVLQVPQPLCKNQEFDVLKPLSLTLSHFSFSECVKFIQVGMNPCQHYYWEDGPDNYFDFLVKKGHISIARTGRSGGISGHSLGDIESEEAEEEEDRGVEVQKICNGVMIDVMNKLDELISLVRLFLFCIVTLLAVMVYVVALK